jgi:NAD-dependent deacetylase
MSSPYQTLARKILKARNAVALTGAGISVESGIPAFRGTQGLWDRYDPMEFAHISAFHANPGKVWGMLRELDHLIVEARPNPAHQALAELEKRNLLKAVITQNVDNLHQDAGSREVVEFHGNGSWIVCLDCGKKVPRRNLTLETLPPRCSCGGLLKPDVVFFGEPIPWEAHQKATRLAASCDLMLVVGTSAVVAPASYLPVAAKRNGAFIAEINPEKTGLSDTLSDLVIHESAGLALPRLLEALEP